MSPNALKLNKVLVFASIFLLIINATYFFIFENTNTKENYTTITSLKTQEEIKGEFDETISTPAPLNSQSSIPTIITPTRIPQDLQIQKSAWIPSFDSKNGLSSFVKNKNKLSAVHYASGSINTSGEGFFTPNTDQILQSLQKEDIPFGVNIIFSDYNGTKRFLQNKNSQKSLEEKLIGFKKFKNFKSVNLNIEKVWKQEKPLLEEYLKEVSKSLHKENLELYITIFPKTDTSENTSPTKQALDYNFLNEVADKVVLMVYDYWLVEATTLEYDFTNSPNDWLEDTVIYAKKYMDNEKIIIGLPLYGYGFDRTTRKITKSYTYNQIQDIIIREGLVIFLDNTRGEIKVDRGNETIIYQDYDSLNIKYSYLKSQGIDQVFFWRLGGGSDLDF